MALDPDRSSGRFTRFGLTWFVQSALFGSGPDGGDDLRPTLEAYVEHAMRTIEESELVGHLDFEVEGAGEQVWEILKDRAETPERWAWMMLQGAAIALQAIEDGDAARAALGTYHAVNGKTLMLYVEQLDEVLWRGYTAEGFRHLEKALADWEANRLTGDEQYWQSLLLENSVLLTQLFAAPMVLHDDQAYVGGKRVTNAGGNVTDFMVRNQLLGSVALVEIKKPTTPLLATGEYRAGVFGASTELSGTITQALKQRDHLTKNYYNLVQGQDEGWTPWDPRVIVIAGDTAQLDSNDKRSSFELVRGSLKDVTIITFDEVFTKAEKLLTLPAGSAN